MADLDEFFAKKDKRKPKGNKFATVEEIAKKLEESRKRMEKLKQEKLLALQLKQQQVNKQRNTIQDDDEWREFEEEKKDYSGLKIHNLVQADYDTKDEGPGGEEIDEKEIEETKAKEEVPKTKKEPWKLVPNSARGDEEPMTPVKPALMQNNAFYMPPSLRKAAKLPSPTPAPDVKNEELFPTLSAATQGKKKVKDDCNRTANSRIDAVKNSKSYKSKYKPPQAQL